LQQISTNNKQIDGIAAQDSARIRGTKEDRKRRKSLPRNYQTNKVLGIFKAQVWRELHSTSGKKMAMKSTGKFSGKGTGSASSIGFKSKYK
jgi:hypothetical protein